MQKIKIIDTDHVFQLDELRSHYMSLMVYLLVAIMRNEQTEEVLLSVRLIHPHLPMVKKLFKIIDSDGSDISEQVYSLIANIHTEAVSSGILV